MGLVTAAIGLGSALLGKSSADKAAKKASQGYNYLLNNDAVAQAQTQGMAAGTQMDQVGGMYGALLGLGGDTEAANQAFQNYQNSTGYQFRLGEGMGAITGSSAARGLLNSGATLKSLTSYGQGLASSEFGNYLNALSSRYSQLENQQQTGLNAAFNVASQGQSAGRAAADYQIQGTQNLVSGLGTAVGGVSDWLQQSYPKTYNYLGGVA